MHNRLPLICIIGPDGVGKTTQARLLEKKLSRMGIPVKYVWMRWNHKLSLPLLALARLLKLSKVEHLQCGRKVVYHHFDRIKPIAIMYKYTLLIDTLISLPFKIYMKLWTGKLVICDRSLFDVLIDLAVSTRNPKLLDSFVAKLFQRLMYRAKIIMLVARSNILKSRRKDVQEDRDLELKINLYNHLMSSSRVNVVNAEEPIAKIHSVLMKMISH